MRRCTRVWLCSCPMYNERSVCQAVIDSACELAWPRERFCVQAWRPRKRAGSLLKQLELYCELGKDALVPRGERMPVHRLPRQQITLHCKRSLSRRALRTDPRP